MTSNASSDCKRADSIEGVTTELKKGSNKTASTSVSYGRYSLESEFSAFKTACCVSRVCRGLVDGPGAGIAGTAGVELGAAPRRPRCANRLCARLGVLELAVP
jgi:hypothetical protein